jgi:hypothetical protein
MAKKDSKKKKDKKGSGATDPVEAVRSAVERTLKATSEGSSGAQKRGRDLVEEVAHAAARFREAMGDLKVLDDLKAEVARLHERVAKLEGGSAKPAAARRTATRSTASRSTAAKSSGTTASRSRSAAAKPAAKKPATTSRARPASSRAKSTGTRSTGTRSTGTRSTRSRSTGSSGTSGSSS